MRGSYRGHHSRQEQCTELKGTFLLNFVLLEHHDRLLGRHLDLLLEQPGSSELRTWRLAEPPGLAPQWAEEIAPHRRAYLHYQGPVYPDRGYVRTWDRGLYESLIDRPGLLRLRCRGAKVWGILELLGDSVDTSAPWACRWTAYYPQTAQTGRVPCW